MNIARVNSNSCDELLIQLDYQTEARIKLGNLGVVFSIVCILIPRITLITVGGVPVQ